MQSVEINLRKDPSVEKEFPKQNIKVKSYYLDLLGNPLENPEETNPNKKQEVALVTVLKANHIPEPHKHKPRYTPKNIRTFQLIPNIVVKFNKEDIVFESPSKGLGKYKPVEQLYFQRCPADFWIFYGGDPYNFNVMNLMKMKPIGQIHDTNNTTAIVKLGGKVEYLTRLWPALDLAEMSYNSELKKAMASYYKKIGKPIA